MKPNPIRFSRGCAALVLAATLSTALLGQVDPTPTPTPATPATMDPTPTPTGSMDTSKDGTVAHSDRAFMKKAAKAGMKEITVSQAVMNNLSNADLKAFAQQMGVELPAKDESSLSEDWMKKTGDVDRKYVKEMVSDHEEAVKLFEKATKSNDPDVAAFAQKTLPILQHHLMMAQDLKKQIN